MPVHKIQIGYDEAAGLTARHRCTVSLAGHEVTHTEALELPPDVTAALKSLIAENRQVMEQAAGVLAVRHVAAVTGGTEPGTATLKVKGGIGAVSRAGLKRGAE